MIRIKALIEMCKEVNKRYEAIIIEKLFYTL